MVRATQADVWAAYERLNGVQDRNRHVIREFDACQDCIYSTLCNGVPLPGRADGLCGACAALLAKEERLGLLAARAARAATRNAQYVQDDGISARPVGPHDPPACQVPIAACGTAEKHRRLASAYEALRLKEGNVQELQSRLRAAMNQIARLEAESAASNNQPAQPVLLAALVMAKEAGEAL